MDLYDGPLPERIDPWDVALVGLGARFMGVPDRRPPLEFNFNRRDGSVVSYLRVVDGDGEWYWPRDVAVQRLRALEADL